MQRFNLTETNIRARKSAAAASIDQFFDNENMIDKERLDAYKKWLEEDPRRVIRTVEQDILEWGQKKGLNISNLMGGRRSRKIHITQKVKAKKSNGRKGRKTRSYKK